MIVSWIAIQSQPIPWEESRMDVAYVACGERPGELWLVRPKAQECPPFLDSLLLSLEKAILREKTSTDRPNLAWLRRAMPDQGTAIRLSSVRRTEVESYEEKLEELATAKHSSP